MTYNWTWFDPGSLRHGQHDVGDFLSVLVHASKAGFPLLRRTSTAMDIEKVSGMEVIGDVLISSSAATVESDSERMIDSDSSHLDGRSKKHFTLTLNVS